MNQPFFQDAKRKLRLMLSEADLSPLTTAVAPSSTGARPKSKKKQGAAAEARGGGGGSVNGGAAGGDKENEVAAFLRVQVSISAARRVICL